MEETSVTLQGKKHIHLIGIGGCSMSGIACILKKQGFEVTGSDRGDTQFTPCLDEAGIPWTKGHTGELMEGADLIIYSAAIKPQNPERVLAGERHIPEMERSVALGQISASYGDVIAIAGCHGKTTITSMLSRVTAEAGSDATIHVGGYVDDLRGGVRVGASDLFITEACEYVESFLTLSPTIALISNIDNDHLDYYGCLENIISAFRKFLTKLRPDGVFVGCVEDAHVKDLLREDAHEHVTYGYRDADYVPADVTYDDAGCASFTVIRRGEPLGRVSLTVPGEHNMLNALGVIAVAEKSGIAFDVTARGLHAFQNTRRRFELMGERNGIRVYHDYGHHPNEIRATLRAATRVPHERVICVFQCNSYTRAKTLFCEDVTCFKEADFVLVPDIYPGREVDDGTVHARDMVAGINRESGNAIYLGTFENIRAWIDENGRPGDIVITVGSGDVYQKTRSVLV